MRQFLKTSLLIATMASLAACGGAQQAGAETEADAKTESAQPTKMTGAAMAELIKRF